MSPIQKKLLAAGVHNLKEFGYPDVTAENILTDYVYRAFFLQMLGENLGNGVDKEINGLMKQIYANEAKDKEAKR